MRIYSSLTINKESKAWWSILELRFVILILYYTIDWYKISGSPLLYNSSNIQFFIALCWSHDDKYNNIKLSFGQSITKMYKCTKIKLLLLITKYNTTRNVQYYTACCLSLNNTKVQNYRPFYWSFNITNVRNNFNGRCVIL